MKEIIIDGFDNWTERQFICNACECIFKATPPDYKTVYTGNKTVAFVAECPHCGADAYTPPELICGVNI